MVKAGHQVIFVGLWPFPKIVEGQKKGNGIYYESVPIFIMISKSKTKM